MQLIRIGEQMKRINLAICVITYKREKGLARLLISIAELIIPDILKEIALFVIDNDVRESAREIVADFRKNFPIDIFYGIESRRGISFARNHALCLAKEYDFIAFVDDDEAVSKNWLLELVQTMLQGDFDLITGPIQPVFETEPPAWLKKMKYFEQKGYWLDKKTKATGSNNMLINRRSLPGFCHSFKF